MHVEFKDINGNEYVLPAIFVALKYKTSENHKNFILAPMPGVEDGLEIDDETYVRLKRELTAGRI